MSQSTASDVALPSGAAGWLRAALGGLFMGLANLVPGISGGTMLLATGVYHAFIESIAAVTTLRLRLHPLLLLAVIGGTAALAILLLAGPTKALVIEQRFAMYSLFIGLTLGGVPLVWRMARPAPTAFFVGALLSFVAMALMAFTTPPSGDAASTPLLLLAGVAGASAMILPGVSGGYLLLLLGQYVPILSAIDSLKQSLVGGLDTALLGEALRVVIPVGIGVVVGIAGVSNLLRWLLARFEKPTLGVLMGLLLGAVVGLWPFQAPVEPQPGDVIKGQVVLAESAREIEVEDWPLERFTPTAGQVGLSLLLIGLGLGGTLALDRLGSDRKT